MTSLMVESLWLGITQIESQEILGKLFIADWPNYKNQKREKEHRALYKMAYPDSKTKRAITPKDLAKILGGKRG